MRFLFVAPDRFPPVRVDIAVLFVKEMRARDYDIDWVLQSMTDCPHGYRTPWEGGTAWVAAMDTRPSKVSRLRKHLQALVNEFRALLSVRRGHYDFLQVKDRGVTALLALLIARLTGTRYFYWQSYPFPELFLHRATLQGARHPVALRLRGQALRWMIYKIAMRGADHVFLQSEKMRENVIAEGVNPGKLSVVPMGVDLDRMPRAAAAPARDGNDPPVVLYLGTLVQDRRLDFLIRVLARVREKVPGAQLHLVGRGERESDERWLRDEAARLGLEDAVVLTGFLPMEDAWRRARMADVCVSALYPSPILDCGSPTKLYEYMALGKAVVVNDHPEQRQVIEASHAGLCTAYEEPAFADAVVQLLRDPRLCREMGERGRRYVQAHRGYGTIARDLDATYRALCADAAPTPSELTATRVEGEGDG